MTKTKTISEKAGELAAWFETKKRHEEDEESIVILKNGAPDELRDSVREAHGDRLPNDWIYATYEAILSTIAGYSIENERQLDDNRGEIVDGLVDVYTSELTGWLHESVYNVAYMDEAAKEYGQAETGDRMIAQAQYMAIDEIYSEVAKFLLTQVEE
jgi:hypothetical protein